MIRMRTLAAALLATTTSVAFAQEGREPRGQGASPPAASQQGGGAQMQRDGGGERGGMERQGASDRGAAQKGNRGGDDNARNEAQRGGDGKKAAKQADSADKREDKAERKAAREQDKDARKEARDERKDDRKQAREERKSGDAAGNKPDDDKAAEGRSRGADDKRNAAETTDPKRGQQADRAGQQPSTSQQTGQSGEQPGQRGQDAASSQQQGAEGQRRTVELSEPDRNKVRDGFRSERSKLKHRTNVNIDITIGRRLPRDWDYYAVPTFLVEIAPRYRGYRYAWVEDRYVLIEPDTYEVVAYVEPDSGRIYESTTIVAAGTRSGSGGGSAGAACEKVELSSDEENAILRLVTIQKTRNLDLDVGTTVPRDVELLTFPDDVLKDHRGLDACRYVAVENDKLAVISMQSRKVVAIIED